MITRLRHSIMFSFVSRYSVLIINLLMMAAMARLLRPDEIGIFMVGASAVMMIDSFREFGVSTYLIQKREVTTAGACTVFTVTLLLSMLTATMLYGLSGPIATFYGEQGLKLVLQFAAASCLLAPFSAPLMALLQRDMAFDKFAIVNVSSALVNCGTSVALAALGFGYMSLAWGSLGASVATVLVVLHLQPTFWIFRPTLQEWRQVMSFGCFATATSMLNVFYQSLPQLILGRLLGFDAVGLYNRATTLCQLADRMILSAVQPVVLPALAAHMRHGGNAREPYLRALSHVTALQWPSLACLALLADPIVRVVLGPQWTEVASLVRIMAPAMLFLFPAFMTYPVLVAVGRIKDTLTASLISLPPSILLTFVAARYGLEAVAASLYLIAPLQVYVALVFIRRHVPFAWGELAVAIRKSAVVTLCTIVAPAAAVAFSGFRFDLPVPIAVAVGAGAAAGWLAGLAVTKHPLVGELRALWARATAALAGVRSAA